MRRLYIAAVALLCALALPAASQWTRVELSCVRETGETLDTGYISRSYASAVCNALNRFESWFPSVDTAWAASFRKAPVPAPDGRVDTSCLDGSCTPTAASLAWDEACLVTALAVIANQQTGTATSIEVDDTTCLDGTNAAAATITEDGGADWSIVSGSLTHAGTNAGSGSITLTATYMGASVNSNAYPWLYQAPPAGDDTAPTIPTGITAVAGDGTVTISGDAPTDPCTAEDCEGVEDVQIQLNGSGTLATVSVGVGLAYDFTATNVNTLSPVPTATQSGADWEIVSAGTADGATDSYMFVNAAHSGAAFATVKVNGITNTANYAKFGLARRASLDGTSIKVECYVMRLADGTLYVQMRRRTSGGSSSTVAQQLISAVPVWLRLTATAGDVHTCEYSTDGNAFSPIGSYTLAMPVPSYWGLMGTATTGTAGATATGDLDQFSLNNVARWSYEHTTATGGSYTARSRDLVATPNASAYSAAVTGVPAAPPATSKHWYPGFYYFYEKAFAANEIVPGASARNGALSSITTMCNEDEWIGIQIIMRWGAAETSLNNYAAGIEFLTAIRNAADACGMKVMVQIFDAVFSYPPGGAPSWGFPSYLFNSPYGISERANSATSSHYTARVWQQATADRRIALNAAYAAAFADDAVMTMWAPIGETSINVDTGVDGFWSAAWMAQLKRIIETSTDAWPNTLQRVQANWVNGGRTAMRELLDFCHPLDCAIGGPDVLPAQDIEANSVFSNEGSTDTMDYRGVLPWVSEVQSPEMCGKEGTYTPSQLYTMMRSGNSVSSPMYPQFIVIDRNFTCAAANNFSAWRTYVETTLSPTGAVMNGSDNTLRTAAAVRTSYCPSALSCQ